MTAARLQPIQVLRGTLLEASPLRLPGWAAHVPAAAAPVPRTPSAEEQQLQQACEAALRESRDRGLRIGCEEGLRQGRSEAAVETQKAVEEAVSQALQPLQAEHARVTRLAQSAQDAVASAVGTARDEIIALCFETICRILGEHAVRPETVCSQVDALLASRGAQEQLRIHVHPQDATLLASRTPDLHWISDPEVSVGGCILRSSAGSIDARLDTMLAACRDALLQVRSTDPEVGRSA